MFKEGPFSKSKGIGIWGDEAIKILEADYWRYYLIANRPETKDSYFDWEEFQKSINNDLNDAVGNFINRTITFICQYFNGKIPKRGKLEKEDITLLDTLKQHLYDYKNAMDSFKLREAIAIAVSVSRVGNTYLSLKQPWHLIKKDRDKAATTLNLCFKVSELLAILLWPFIPTKSEKMWHNLGFKENIVDNGIENFNVEEEWEGRQISKTPPIFQKVKAKVLVETLKNIRKKTKKEEQKMSGEKISYEEFKKVELKIATIVQAEPIEKSKNLIKLKVNLGAEERQIIAGIKRYYKAEELIGRQIVVVANLKPAKMMGELSDGMLLAADVNGEPVLLHPDKEVPPGSEVR